MCRSYSWHFTLFYVTVLFFLMVFFTFTRKLRNRRAWTARSEHNNTFVTICTTITGIIDAFVGTYYKKMNQALLSWRRCINTLVVSQEIHMVTLHKVLVSVLLCQTPAWLFTWITMILMLLSRTRVKGEYGFFFKMKVFASPPVLLAAFAVAFSLSAGNAARCTEEGPRRACRFCWRSLFICVFLEFWNQREGDQLKSQTFPLSFQLSLIISDQFACFLFLRIGIVKLHHWLN